MTGPSTAWARPPALDRGEVVDLGHARGYRHLENARRWTGSGAAPPLRWGESDDLARLVVSLPPEAELIVAEDPEPSDARIHGQLEPAGPRSTVMVRARGRKCAFISMWSFGRDAGETSLSVERRDPAGQVVLRVSGPSSSRRISLPMG